MNLNYVLLDAARLNAQFDLALKYNVRNVFLFNTKEEQHLQTVGPHLFSYDSKTDFATWLFNEGWGNAWGVYFTSKANMDQLFTHFADLNLEYTEDGQVTFFRYYDPRVMNRYLSINDIFRLKRLFGPVEKFICEDRDERYALIYSFDGKQLTKERVVSNIVFSRTDNIPPTTILSANKNNSGTESDMGIKQKPPGWFS
jgi:hypothetical protein